MPVEFEFGSQKPPPPPTPWRGVAQMLAAVALGVAAFFVTMSVPNWVVWLFSAFLFLQGARDFRKAQLARKR